MTDIIQNISFLVYVLQNDYGVFPINPQFQVEFSNTSLES